MKVTTHRQLDLGEIAKTLIAALDDDALDELARRVANTAGGEARVRHASAAEPPPRAVPQLLTAKDLETRLNVMPKRS